MALYAFPALRGLGFERDPFALVRDIQHEMNSVFDRSANADASTYPALNVWMKNDEALVTAELPGLSASDIDLSVSGRTLTLRGRRAAQTPGEGEQYHRRERGTGEFSRTVELPFPVDSAHVDASFAKGVLKIRLPRAESDKPRKISIN